MFVVLTTIVVILWVHFVFNLGGRVREETAKTSRRTKRGERREGYNVNRRKLRRGRVEVRRKRRRREERKSQHLFSVMNEC